MVAFIDSGCGGIPERKQGLRRGGADPGVAGLRAIADMAALAQALAVFFLALAAMLARPAAAQEATGISYITPFPEGDIYVLQAYGDPFAEGMLSGLTESFPVMDGYRCRNDIAPSPASRASSSTTS